jgi:hypothetical protein
MSRDALDEIRRLYFRATAATIQRDLDRAIDLLKSLRDEDERSRAAVFMEGLAEMRREWRPAGPRPPGAAKRPKKR